VVADFIHKRAQALLGASQPGNGNERRLARVLARRLAEAGGIPFSIKKVVGDLESQSKRLAVARKRRTFGERGATEERAGITGKLDERAGFHGLQAPHVIEVGRWRTLEFVGLQIEALSPNHAGRSRGCGQSAHELGASWSASGLANRPNATVKSASPARIAVHSSKALCTVGLPRRRSSLSMAGKSSCTSE
jgi:hypothetical protein